MTEKRSIQDIIPPARSKPIRERQREESAAAEQPTSSKKLPMRAKRPRSSTGLVGMFGIALAVILIVGAAFGVV